MNKEVSILGCGWLGKALAIELIKQGWTVKGSTTSLEKMEEFKKLGIIPFLINLENSSHFPAEFLSGQLIISIPPGRNRNYIDYPSRIRFILSASENLVKRVILISSTAVYPQQSGSWNEAMPFTPDSESSKAMLDGEALLLASHAVSSAIIRFSGLIDSDRNPATFSKNSGKVLTGNEPVNMIHRLDCIRILHKLLEHPDSSGIFNACADKHPLREEFYRAAFIQKSSEIPQMNHSNDPLLRIINGEKLKAELGYQYQFSDPVSFF
jgi:nucleoside-diphosphate-sugar epimerase